MKSAITLTLIASATVVHAADWPAWRGTARDGLSQETGLLQSWPESGPKKLWTSSEAGIGYSSFSVAGDRLYTLGADAENEYVLALDANTGSKLWQTSIGPRLSNGWGDGPRSTPTIAGDLVIALGGEGGLRCVSAKDGSLKWSAEMQKLGGSIPKWGYSESPLVDGDKVLCTPGGSDGTVVAFDLKSGKELWQSSDITEGAHYSSILAVDHFGKRQYIQLTETKVFGLDANGNLQWQADWPGRVAVIPTPIYQDGLVYVTSGYGVGCMLLKVDASNNVEKLYDNKVMKNHHGGTILLDGHIYGHSNGVGWICQNMLSGELIWNEKSKLGKGAMAYADGMLYCLSETDGSCVLAKATPAGWEEHGRFVLQPQTEQRSIKGKVWTHPVIANGRLYLRDQEIVCCYDIAE